LKRLSHFLFALPVTLHEHDLLAHELLLVVELHVHGLELSYLRLKLVQSFHQELGVANDFLEVFLKVLNFADCRVLEELRDLALALLDCFLHVAQDWVFRFQV